VALIKIQASLDLNPGPVATARISLKGGRFFFSSSFSMMEAKKEPSPFFMGLGERPRAFEWPAKALEERSGFLVYIKCDRRFDGLRSDPRHEALLKRIGLPPGTVKS
jgi:hypothetical protein